MARQKEAPWWFWLALSGAIFVYLGYIVVPMIHCHYTGKETIAVVTNTSTQMEGGVGMDTPHQVKYYTLTFDGHSVKKRTSGNHKVGKKFSVIYSVNDPEIVVRGSRAGGLWNTIARSTNEKLLAIATCIALFFTFAAFKTKAQQAGRTKP